MRTNRLIFYASLYGSSAAFLKVVGFGLFLWLPRTLSVESYAEFGLFYALQTGLTTLAIAGIVEVAVGLLRHNQPIEEQKRLFGLTNTAFMLMAGAAFIFAAIVFAVFGKSRYEAIATVVYALLGGILLAFSTLQSQIARLQEHHLQALCFNALVPLASLIGAFCWFVIERTIQSFFLGSAVGVLGVLLMLWWLRIGFYEKASQVSDTQVMFRGISPFLIIAFLGWLTGYGNNYFIDVLLMPTDVAGFTFLLSLSAVIQLVASALNQVWSPRFYRISQVLPFDEVERQNRLAFRWLGVALGLSGGALIVLFSPTLNAIGGNLVAYQAMRFELLLMVLAYIVAIPWWHCHNYYLVHGKGTELMKLTLLLSLIGLATWIILMWRLGSLGVYLGFFAQMLFRALGIIIAAKRHWPVSIAWEGVAFGTLFAVSGFLTSLL